MAKPLTTELIKKKNQFGAVVYTCNPSTLGGWGGRIAWTQEAEVAVSQDHVIEPQPGPQKRNSISKNKNKIFATEQKTINYAINI